MAQLNPNFEIDFSDINSYEQIQLINDTQLAKENLLMHRAYKEPSDDAIIKNHFSSFTFVDFCPTIYTSSSRSSLNNSNHNPEHSTPANANRSLKCYELETFSDLFERINSWLKLHKDWRVVSMETLVFDCKTQFNHLKSSIHSNYLPQNTRGLRLFLSPSKSRFSGPQKIGCINVVPRKISGSHTNPNDPPKYETLDEILARLNELLLTRPIEGRILSVETITLPMVNGYVNTELNYFMDSRLNLLYQNIYNVCAHNNSNNDGKTDSSGNQTKFNDSNHQTTTTNTTTSSSGSNHVTATTSAGHHQKHTLIDILRVYYEFGPMICGLVNLIDFVPRFYSPTPTFSSNQPQQSGSATPDNQPSASVASGDQVGGVGGGGNGSGEQPTRALEKIAATESLTRLIRRSLAWFETERKRILHDTCPGSSVQEKTEATATTTNVEDNELSATTSSSLDGNRISPTSTVDKSFDDRTVKGVDIKCCSLQVHHKIMLKNELIQVNPSNTLELVQTRLMAHDRPSLRDTINCQDCCISTNQPTHIWCQHLLDLCQPYELKFVRLAYVVPVYNVYARSMYPLVSSNRSLLIGGKRLAATTSDQIVSPDLLGAISDETSSSSTTSGSKSASPEGSPMIESKVPRDASSHSPEPEIENIDESEIERTDDMSPDEWLDPVLINVKDEESIKQMALDILSRTNRRLLEDEISYQKGETEDAFMDAPIGQLTYRLFAPCQLVNSSSCFSINPVNSSSPLSRRGSLDLNGSGLSSDNAHPSTLLLGNPSSSSSANTSHDSQQVMISFGAMFPTLTHDIMSTSSGSSESTKSPNSKFTTNEFEPVDAIRRRMEVYVTTNSMKVIAGETLIVNLSDATSCLSTAIERTVVKSSIGQRTAGTWASVYVLYAAVEEPLMPSQLLASQKHREQLSMINEEPNEESDQVESEQAIFDDDFKGNLDAPATTKNSPATKVKNSDKIPQAESESSNTVNALSATFEESIRIEENPEDSSLTLYNSAYDRTVALPTRPDNQTANLDPIDHIGSLSDCLWLDEADIIEAQQRNWSSLSDAELKKHKRKRKSKKRHSEDSQCSIM